MATKSSIHIKPCRVTSSGAHNRRTAEYMRNIGESRIVSGGYEIRNQYFKGCIALLKEIAHIKQPGTARETCYVFEGFMGLSFISYFEIGELPEISRTGQARLYGVELSSQCFQSNLSVGKLWAHPLFL